MHTQSREALNHLAYTIAAGGSGWFAPLIMELVWFEFEESEKRGEGRSHRSFNYRGSIVV